MRRALTFIVCTGLVLFGWRQYRLATARAIAEAEGAPLGVEQSEPAATAKYHCDGRRYCSQMTSCEEATWFLQHCPGTKMDGEGDGVPCERQWCGHH